MKNLNPPGFFDGHFLLEKLTNLGDPIQNPSKSNKPRKIQNKSTDRTCIRICGKQHERLFHAMYWDRESESENWHDEPDPQPVPRLPA